MLPEGKVSGQKQHGYTIHKVDRFDAGRYTCKADNGVGTPATAHIALQVLCKYYRVENLKKAFLTHLKKQDEWPDTRKVMISYRDYSSLSRTYMYSYTYVYLSLKNCIPPDELFPKCFVILNCLYKTNGCI